MSAEMLTLKEVAEACRVHVSSIHTAIRKGHLRVVKLSVRNWRITREEFERWIASRQAEQGGAK